MLYTNTQAILKYIRQQMVVKDLNIKDISQRMNKSQSATSGLLKQSNITLDTLNELCQAIDCQLDINIIDIDKESK